MAVDATSSVFNFGILDSLNNGAVEEILASWNGFCSATEALLKGNGDLSFGSEFVLQARTLCKHGLESLAQEHFLGALQETFEKNGASKFWQHFDAYTNVAALEISTDPIEKDKVQQVLCKALEDISLEKQYQEKCLSMLVYAVQSCKDSTPDNIQNSDSKKVYLLSKYQLMVSSVLMATLPRHFPEVLHRYFKGKLEDLNTCMAGDFEDDNESQDKDYMDLDERSRPTYTGGDMDIDGSSRRKSLLENRKIVRNIGMVVRVLRSLGFTSMAEDAYSSAIFLLLKAKVRNLVYKISIKKNLFAYEYPSFYLLPTFHFALPSLLSKDYEFSRSSDLSWLRSVKATGKMAQIPVSEAYLGRVINALAKPIDGRGQSITEVHNLAGDDYRSSVLKSIKEWIKTVPLQFLHALLDYLGPSINYDSPSSGLKSPLASRPSSFDTGIDNPTEELVRWQLRLEYFAYETLQDLRIAKLFEIIVDYPDSSPAIEDLKQCLEYTGQHSKLVDLFISALRYRLLTAGASTNDILHQYVSTIKALRTIDPAGVFLEAVGEPIREYLKGRKDTIKCIVTMLTDGSGGNSGGAGNSGDSLLEELNRDEESQENSCVDDDTNTDDKQAWINAQSWEPDPVEADPLKGSRSRRKVDILGMIVSIIGSKDQLVNEYRVMLAEKLLSKSDYDIDAEIRTLELLKIHFGESSMQRCEIMLNDLIDSKRTNTNIKATINQPSRTETEAVEKNEVSLDILTATIISSNFWPPIQDEALNIPEPVEQLFGDYARRFTEIKTPRKLLWKKNLGTVKLELQFEDKSQQFTVTPMHASIIMQFQEQTSWTSKNLAAVVGVPINVLNRRINFWISKGILSESSGADTNDHIFTLVDGTVDSKTGANSGGFEDLLVGDEDGERSVASVEDQLRKEMTVYEKFLTGMLTNFGSMALEKIHNTLKMFCVADPTYDKSLQQLQSFLSGLVAEDKLELRDGMYFLKK